MTNALLLHGKPPRERYEDPTQLKPHETELLLKLKAKLEARGIPTDIPAFPDPHTPNTVTYERTLQPYRIDRETRFAAHSFGCKFMLWLMSKHPELVIDRLILVAPYEDYAGKYGPEWQVPLAADIGRRVLNGIEIFHSTDDDPNIARCVRDLRRAIPDARYREFTGHGHFMLGNNMTTTEFPELLDAMIA